jgi:DNA-binding CsgD family transcriptional regulator/tetratricopeptide (TPR) repeat protein
MSALAPPRLLERDAELAAVEGLVEIGSGGRLLVIEGPPGIGKTALLAEAKAQAREAGLQLLNARGSELERSFSYGVVRQLFEPFLAAQQSAERAELVSGAASLAAPLFEPDQVAAGPAAESSLGTMHGLYWLAANATTGGPLLLVVDDLHWCDLPSLRWLAYLLPRIEGLDVSLLVSLRNAEPGEDPELVGRIVTDPLATVIRPAPLTREAAASVVHDALTSAADDAFCEACWEETGGNPLLLRELVHVVATEGLVPVSSNVARLHELGARAGARAVSLRLSQLPAEATALAHAVAVLGDDADPMLAAALADLEVSAALEAAEGLVRADILRPHWPFGFVHPLFRTAVYESLTPHERDRGHARAAQLLSEAGAEPELVAMHVLHSSPASDPRAVATLRDAARRAGARGASENAVDYLRRALAEPPAADELVDLLLELGTAEVRVSGDDAVEHLRTAYGLIDDPVRKAQAGLLLGRQLFFLRGEEADRVYAEALEELAGADLELERLLEAALITNDLFMPGLHEAALERLERVRGRVDGVTPGEKLLLALLAYHDARAGVPADGPVQLARRALADDELLKGFGGSTVPACTVLAMADLDEVLVIYDDLQADGRKRGSTLQFAAAKVFGAQPLLWRGELVEAEENAREALALADEWGTSARFSGHAAAFLGDSLMEQGRLDEAEAVLAEANSDDSLPDTVRQLFLRDSNARLRILRGDPARGAEELLAAGRAFDAVGSRNPAFIAWRSSAAFAKLQLGERDEALRLAGEELELARTWGAPRALGAALRAAGTVEGGEQGLALLEEAVEVLSESPAKLEHAKARADLGAALRRANRRSQAREQLRHAVELATICGATSLAERAESELLATGARPRRIALSGVDSLTPSERRIAEMAAEGPTNREIAQELFVTQRTVEVHLTSIYRKLGISSRSQLAAALHAPAHT